MSSSATVLFRRLISRTKLKHIEVLVRLSQYGSMGRAAESLGMSQPAVSQIVSELEKILETELFLRHARGIEPTAMLRDILPMAQRILIAAAESAESVAARLESQDGPVRVYATPAAVNGLLIHALPSFAELHPNIQIVVAEEATPDSTTRIATNECDILALRQPTVVPESWLFEPIMDDALIVICHRRHALARTGAATLDELSQYRWLMSRLGSISRNRFEEVAEAAGWPNEIRRHVITHVPALTLQMLSAGRDLALVPRSLAMPWLQSGETVEIRCDVSTSLAPLGFLWQGPRAGQATRRFANYLRRQTFRRNDNP